MVTSKDPGHNLDMVIAAPPKARPVKCSQRLVGRSCGGSGNGEEVGMNKKCAVNALPEEGSGSKGWKLSGAFAEKAPDQRNKVVSKG